LSYKYSDSSLDIAKNVSLIESGVRLSQLRLINRAIRQTTKIRKGIDGSFLYQAITQFVPDASQNKESFLEYASKVPIDSNLGDTLENPEEKTDSDPISEVFSIETEVYLSILVITSLLKHNMDEEAALASTLLVQRIKLFNRRTLDPLSSKAYFYFSISYERLGLLSNIRSTLLSLHRTACVHHDEMGSAVLLNLLLRNFLSCNLIGQASKLISKTSFPENASNPQFCRYLLYVARVQAVQMDYSDAFARLNQAQRKAPQGYALGFISSV